MLYALIYSISIALPLVSLPWGHLLPAQLVEQSFSMLAPPQHVNVVNVLLIAPEAFFCLNLASDLSFSHQFSDFVTFQGKIPNLAAHLRRSHGTVGCRGIQFEKH